MRETKPPRVADKQAFWEEPPPEPSPRLAWWLERVRGGWLPNRRLSGMGYYDAAEYYGVWIWEYVNVLFPAIEEARAREVEG